MSFAAPATADHLAACSRFKPIIGDDKAFREVGAFRVISTLIGTYLRHGISRHTLIPDIKRCISEAEFNRAAKSDPLLAGMAIDKLYFDANDGSYNLPLYRPDASGKSVAAYIYKFSIKGDAAGADWVIPIGDDEHVYVKVEPLPGYKPPAAVGQAMVTIINDNLPDHPAITVTQEESDYYARSKQLWRGKDGNLHWVAGGIRLAKKAIYKKGEAIARRDITVKNPDTGDGRHGIHIRPACAIAGLAMYVKARLGLDIYAKIASAKKDPVQLTTKTKEAATTNLLSLAADNGAIMTFILRNGAKKSVSMHPDMPAKLLDLFEELLQDREELEYGFEKHSTKYAGKLDDLIAALSGAKKETVPIAAGKKAARTASDPEKFWFFHEMANVLNVFTGSVQLLSRAGLNRKAYNNTAAIGAIINTPLSIEKQAKYYYERLSRQYIQNLEEAILKEVPSDSRFPDGVDRKELLKNIKDYAEFIRLYCGHHLGKTEIDEFTLEETLALYPSARSTIGDITSFDFQAKGVRLYTDKIALFGVIKTLMLNAREAGIPDKENKITLRTRLARDGKSVSIRIEDHGRGLSQKDLADLMSGKTGAGLAYGEGFGAYAVKELVEKRLGGTIVIESRPESAYPKDHGTAVTIMLPITKAPQKEAQAKMARPGQEHAGPSRPKAADDSALIAAIEAQNEIFNDSIRRLLKKDPASAAHKARKILARLESLKESGEGFKGRSIGLVSAYDRLSEQLALFIDQADAAKETDELEKLINEDKGDEDESDDGESSPGSESWGRIPMLTWAVKIIGAKYGISQNNRLMAQTLLEQKIFWSMNLLLLLCCDNLWATAITWSAFFIAHYVPVKNMPQAPPWHKIIAIAFINALPLAFLPTSDVPQLAAAFGLATGAHLILNQEPENKPSLLSRIQDGLTEMLVEAFAPPEKELGSKLHDTLAELEKDMESLGIRPEQPTVEVTGEGGISHTYALHKDAAGSQQSTADRRQIDAPRATAYDCWKPYLRAFDITASLALLPALVIATIIIAPMIKLTSTGPVFYAEERIGYKRQPYTIYKFRTLTHTDKPEERMHTRAGLLLRRTLLDELPQVINILKGEMSFFGPRPLAMDNLKDYPGYVKVFDDRRPGGFSLFAARRGFGMGNKTTDELKEAVALDAYEKENWSAALMWQIVRETIRTLFKNATWKYGAAAVSVKAEYKGAKLRISYAAGLDESSRLFQRWQKRTGHPIYQTLQIGLAPTFAGVSGDDEALAKEFFRELVASGLAWKQSIQEDLFFVIENNSVTAYSGIFALQDAGLTLKARELLGQIRARPRESMQESYVSLDSANAQKRVVVSGMIAQKEAESLAKELVWYRHRPLARLGKISVRFDSDRIEIISENDDRKALEEVLDFVKGFYTIIVFSDTHIAGKGPEDNFGPERERELIRLIDHAAKNRSLIVINGDFLELWQESYGRIKRAYGLLFRALRNARRVIYVAGNHDEAVLQSVVASRMDEVIKTAKANLVVDEPANDRFRQLLGHPAMSGTVKELSRDGFTFVLSGGFADDGIALDDRVFYVDRNILEIRESLGDQEAAEILAKLVDDIQKSLTKAIHSDLGKNAEIAKNYADPFRGLYFEHGHIADPSNYRSFVGRWAARIVGWFEKAGWKNAESDLLRLGYWLKDIFGRIIPWIITSQVKIYAERILALGSAIKGEAPDRGPEWTIFFGHTHHPVNINEGPLNKFSVSLLNIRYANTGTWSSAAELKKQVSAVERAIKTVASRRKPSGAQEPFQAKTGDGKREDWFEVGPDDTITMKNGVQDLAGSSGPAADAPLNTPERISGFIGKIYPDAPQEHIDLVIEIALREKIADEEGILRLYGKMASRTGEMRIGRGGAFAELSAAYNRQKENGQERSDITAEEVFVKIGLTEDYEISGASLVDRMGFGKDDRVLCIGAANDFTYPVACAIRNASVDVCQPLVYVTNSQHTPGIHEEQTRQLEEDIAMVRRRISETYYEDLLGDRIDTSSYRDLAERASLPQGAYSHVLLFNVLDDKKTADKDALIRAALSSLKDGGAILLSSYIKTDKKILRLVRRVAKASGYRIEKARTFTVVFRGTSSVAYELKARRIKNVQTIAKTVVSNNVYKETRIRREISEAPDKARTTSKEFMKFLKLLAEDPHFSYGDGESRVDGSIEYDEIPREFAVEPSEGFRKSHPELATLDMPATDDYTPSGGLFGVIRVKIVECNGQPAMWINEVQPSLGFRNIQPLEARQKFYGWNSGAVQHLVRLAHQAGFNYFYGSTMDEIKDRYAKRLRISIPKSNLQQNYLYPFRHNWDEVNAVIDGRETRLWYREVEASLTATVSESLDMLMDNAMRQAGDSAANGDITTGRTSLAQMVPTAFLTDTAKVDVVAMPDDPLVRRMMDKIRGGDLSDADNKPIRIDVNADGKVSIFDGMHRIAALKELGVEYVPAHVVYYNKDLIGKLPFKNIDIQRTPYADMLAKFLRAAALTAVPLTMAGCTRSDAIDLLFLSALMIIPILVLFSPVLIILIVARIAYIAHHPHNKYIRRFKKGDPSAIPELIELFWKKGYGTKGRLAIIKALGKTADEAVVRMLLKAVNEPYEDDYDVQLLSRSSLDKMGRKAIPALLKVLNDDDSAICHTAAKILSTFTDPDIDKPLEDALRRLANINSEFVFKTLASKARKRGAPQAEIIELMAKMTLAMMSGAGIATEFASKVAIPAVAGAAKNIEEFEAVIDMAYRLTKCKIGCCDILEAAVPAVFEMAKHEPQKTKNLLEILEDTEHAWYSRADRVAWPRDDGGRAFHGAHQAYIKKIVLPLLTTYGDAREVKSMVRDALYKAEVLTLKEWEEIEVVYTDGDRTGPNNTICPYSLMKTFGPVPRKAQTLRLERSIEAVNELVASRLKTAIASDKRAESSVAIAANEPAAPRPETQDLSEDYEETASPTFEKIHRKAPRSHREKTRAAFTRTSGFGGPSGGEDLSSVYPAVQPYIKPGMTPEALLGSLPAEMLALFPESKRLAWADQILAMSAPRASYTGLTIKKPLSKIPEGDIRNILVVAEFRGVIMKDLEESTIMLWPLVTGLMKKYPGALIHVASEPLAAFSARQFRGITRFVPPQEFAEIWANKEKRGRFLSENRIDLLIDISDHGDYAKYTGESFEGATRPHIILSLSPVAQIAPLNPRLISKPMPIIYTDRQGTEYDVAGRETMLAMIADPTMVEKGTGSDGERSVQWSLKTAGAWLFPIETYRLLGLETTVESLPAVHLGVEESVSALGWMRRLFDETNADGSAGSFDPEKKIIIVNAYASDISKQSLISKNEWIGILIALMRDIDDSYIVVSCGEKRNSAAFYADMQVVVNAANAEMVRRGIQAKSKVLLPATTDVQQYIDNIVGISSAALALDAGFSHLANGVYGIPVFSITSDNTLHMLPPRKNARSITLPADEVSSIFGMMRQKAASSVEKTERLREGIRAFIKAVNSELERPEARIAKLSALSVAQRAELDSELLENSYFEGTADEKDLTDYIYSCVAAITEDPASLPRYEIRYVDTARQNESHLASYKAKLSTTRDHKTFFFIDRSAMEEKDGKLVVREEVKGFEILHEIMGHIWARYMFADFAQIHPADTSKYSQETIDIRKVEEEIVAWTMALMAMKRLDAVAPHVLGEKARQRIHRTGVDLQAGADLSAYLQKALNYIVHGSDDPYAYHYKGDLEKYKETILSDIHSKYLPLLSQMFGEGEGATTVQAENGEPKAPAGSPLHIWRLLRTEFAGSSVTAAQIRRAITARTGRKSPDGRLSLATTLRDLQTLYFLSALEKEGSGDEAKYRAADLGKRDAGLLEEALRSLGPRPSGRQKAAANSYLTSKNYLKRRNLNKLINDSFAEADASKRKAAALRIKGLISDRLAMPSKAIFESLVKCAYIEPDAEIKKVLAEAIQYAYSKQMFGVSKAMLSFMSEIGIYLKTSQPGDPVQAGGYSAVLASAVEEAIDISRHEWRTDINVSYDGARPDMPLTAKENSSLKEIVAELIVNAIKFGMNPSIRLASDKGYLVAEVHDRGPGIAFEKLSDNLALLARHGMVTKDPASGTPRVTLDTNRIAELMAPHANWPAMSVAEAAAFTANERYELPFVFGLTSQNHRLGYGGVGLYLARKYARRAGGDITYITGPDRTVFTLRMPVRAQAGAEPAPSDVEHAFRLAGITGTLKDDRHDRETVVMMKATGLTAGQKVLSVGPARQVAHLLYASIQGARVDVNQPEFYDIGFPDNSYLIPHLKILIEKLESIRDGKAKANINATAYPKPIQEAGIPESEYDYVVMLQVLDAPNADSRQIAAEALRAVKDGGIIVMSTLTDTGFRQAKRMLRALTRSMFDGTITEVVAHGHDPIVALRVRKNAAAKKSGGPGQRPRGSGRAMRYNVAAHETVSACPAPDAERIRAIIFADAVKRVRASKQKEPVILALGTSWIKGYGAAGGRQRDDMNRYIVAIRRFCTDHGVTFIDREDEGLAAEIEKARQSSPHARVVVLAGRDAVTSPEFKSLRDDPDAFLAGVDADGLDETCYLRVAEMLRMALTLGLRDIFAAAASIDNPAIRAEAHKDFRNVYIFQPKAEKITSYDDLRRLYMVQEFA